jgi:hypothetical protein
MTIAVNRLMSLRWLMERQTDGLRASSNIRQTYARFLKADSLAGLCRG